MIVKEKFDLVYGTRGDVYNVLPLSGSTLKGYEISKEDRKYLLNIASIYGKSRNHFMFPILQNNINEISILNFPLYPLPGFVTKKGQACINLSTIPAAMLTDYSSADIYSMLVYSYCLKHYIDKKPFNLDSAEHISAFIFSVFMKFFGKRSGLLGAYRSLIPRLRLIIMLYVYVGMFGEKQTETLINRLSGIVYCDSKEVKLDYDFKNTKEFLKAINQNNIIPISENTLSTNIINVSGITGVPVFEDVSRFFATMLASTCPGTSQFSTFWSKIRKELFLRLVNIGTINIK